MATKINHAPLSMSVLGALGTIANAAQGNEFVTWTRDGGDTIHQGTARSIGDERGMFLGRDHDVRDGFLRITSVTGMEHFIPIMELVIIVQEGGFAVGR
jgi:hypothetical protein